MGSGGVGGLITSCVCIRTDASSYGIKDTSRYGCYVDNMSAHHGCYVGCTSARHGLAKKLEKLECKDFLAASHKF